MCFKFEFEFDLYGFQFIEILVMINVTSLTITLTNGYWQKYAVYSYCSNILTFKMETIIDLYPGTHHNEFRLIWNYIDPSR